ncbi:iron complex transport system substrate-binding protein [Rhodococcus sp. 27YEA15]|uniref:ABC transporter substrate-binding protein n=1 Tax=Rhodococcus sp. 27YEA15 TaxID=3156259 RepID=UPI003C7BFAFC
MFGTKTAFGIVAALILTIAGATACGRTSTTEDQSQTRPVTHEFGTVEVPTSPQRILALDEYAGLSALTLGVKPTVVFSTLRSDVAKSILAEQGIEVIDKSGFFANPAIEEIATIEPDEILMSNAGPLPGLYGQINAIAPTLVLPYSAPWRDVLSAAGTQLDRESEANAVISKLETRLDTVKTAAAGKSLAILGGFAGSLFTVPPTTPLSTLVGEAGFTRPAAESDATTSMNSGSIAPLSAELLSLHGAENVAVMSGRQYDSALVRNEPLFVDLTSDPSRAYDVSGDLWFGSHPFAVYWIIEDLSAIADGRGQSSIGTPENAAARWTAFSAL